MVNTKVMPIQSQLRLYVDGRIVTKRRPDPDRDADRGSFVKQTSQDGRTFVYGGKTGDLLGIIDNGVWLQRMDVILFDERACYVELLPGHHKIELATRVVCWAYPDRYKGLPRRGKFPFTLTAEHVEAMAGEKLWIDLGQDLQFDFGPSDPDDDWRSFTEEAYQRLEHKYKSTIDDVNADPVLNALVEAVKSPPLQRYLWLNLPNEYGGPREVDADQIRDIVDWLREKHWSWGRGSPTVAVPAGSRSVTKLADEMDRLEQLIRQMCDAMDRYKVIAEKLEKAGQDRNVP